MNGGKGDCIRHGTNFQACTEDDECEMVYNKAVGTRICRRQGQINNDLRMDPRKPKKKIRQVGRLSKDRIDMFDKPGMSNVAFDKEGQEEVMQPEVEVNLEQNNQQEIIQTNDDLNTKVDNLAEVEVNKMDEVKNKLEAESTAKPRVDVSMEDIRDRFSEDLGSKKFNQVVLGNRGNVISVNDMKIMLARKVYGSASNALLFTMSDKRSQANINRDKMIELLRNGNDNQIMNEFLKHFGERKAGIRNKVVIKEKGHVNEFDLYRPRESRIVEPAKKGTGCSSIKNISKCDSNPRCETVNLGNFGKACRKKQLLQETTSDDIVVDLNVSPEVNELKRMLKRGSIDTNSLYPDVEKVSA